MELEFLVQNVKCNGCAGAIRAGLSKQVGVREVRVDVPTGRVSVLTEGDIRAELGASYSYASKPLEIYGPYFGDEARLLYDWGKAQ